MPDERPVREEGVLAVDEQVGGDDDQPGIAQPVTQTEIDDLLNNPEIPIEERRARLQDLAERLGDRDNIDRGDEFAPLEVQIADALAMLAEGGHTYGTVEGMGMDSASRSDLRSPDDTDEEDADREL